MKTFSFYDTETGLFSDVKASCGPEQVGIFLQPGQAAIEGDYDPLNQRVDLESGQVVAYQPTAPANDELRTWAWNPSTRRYEATLTEAGIAAAQREQRDQLLAACDWVVTRSIDMGEQVPAEWAAYRQALRDVPDQAGFPGSVVWPVAPG